jgi:hypothetical protein
MEFKLARLQAVTVWWSDALNGYSNGLEETMDCDVAELLIYNRKLR